MSGPKRLGTVMPVRAEEIQAVRDLSSGYAESAEEAAMFAAMLLGRDA
ncbi:hypothetical protein [Mycetocola tolaasinivorans]|nr:hypothetical protein [Mycetocola tolaasinivorans]